MGAQLLKLVKKQHIFTAAPACKYMHRFGFLLQQSTCQQIQRRQANATTYQQLFFIRLAQIKPFAQWPQHFNGTTGCCLRQNAGALAHHVVEHVEKGFLPRFGLFWRQHAGIQHGQWAAQQGVDGRTDAHHDELPWIGLRKGGWRAGAHVPVAGRQLLVENDCGSKLHGWFLCFPVDADLFPLVSTRMRKARTRMIVACHCWGCCPAHSSNTWDASTRSRSICNTAIIRAIRQKNRGSRIKHRGITALSGCV